MIYHICWSARFLDQKKRPAKRDCRSILVEYNTLYRGSYRTLQHERCPEHRASKLVAADDLFDYANGKSSEWPSKAVITPHQGSRHVSYPLSESSFSDLIPVLCRLISGQKPSPAKVSSFLGSDACGLPGRTSLPPGAKVKPRGSLAKATMEWSQFGLALVEQLATTSDH
jgi:hypothetical protein